MTRENAVAEPRIERIRRLVSGENEDGKAIFAVIEDVEPIMRGANLGRWYGVWGWDEQPELPVRPSEGYKATSMHPPPGGIRVNITEFAPGRGRRDPAKLDDVTPEDRAAREQFAKLLLTDRSNYEPSPDSDATGLRRTESIDICFVLKGKLYMALDDEVEELLQAGDVFIQNGTMHDYRNPFDEPCVMAFVVFPASRHRPPPL